MALPLAACLVIALRASAAAPLEHRWLYLSSNLLVPENVARAETLFKRASAAGYNGVLLADYKFHRLGLQPPEYFANARKLRRAADEARLDLYPAVCPVGYSNGLLSLDPNLGEGMPVQDALFVERGGVAVLEPDPPVALVNGGFEDAQGDALAGWTLQDDPGRSSFMDRTEKHGGAASLRFERIGDVDSTWGHGRLAQAVAVAPWRQYHVSVWIKTREFERPGELRAVVLPEGEGERSLSYNLWNVQRSQDWTQHHLVFNSQRFTRVTLYLGAWEAKGGTFWLDDAVLEETGLTNVLRRAGCPVRVRGEQGPPMREGKDFAPIADALGEGDYDVWHPSPPIKLLRCSRVTEGRRLRVSFHHAVSIHHEQASCCLSDPKVYALLEDEITRVNALFRPKGFFMSHDELRVANWCDACQARKLTPGQMLADNVKRCAGFIRAASPAARIFVWSDMFDPAHNARDGYYLVNGSWAGAWEGLDRDIVIANWHFAKRRENMPWFAARGHRQLLAGYYDGDPASIRTWLDDARDVPGVIGAIYTTWVNNYDDLETFAAAAWGLK